MSRVVITIPQAGLSTNKRFPTIDGEGFKGGACKAATAAFERVIGAVRDVQNKPELYETSDEVHIEQ